MCLCVHVWVRACARVCVSEKKTANASQVYTRGDARHLWGKPQTMHTPSNSRTQRCISGYFHHSTFIERCQIPDTGSNRAAQAEGVSYKLCEIKTTAVKMQNILTAVCIMFFYEIE